MNTYIIPTFKLDNLQKQINHIKNKGVDVTFNISSPYKKKVSPLSYIEVVDVGVEGKYKINGWEFVATVEHTDHGNIIRRAPGMEDVQIPEKYKTIGQECEHCHIIRDRKDTYLVYNEDTKEFKQVGRTCLKNYTNGLDAETCTQLSSLEAYLNSDNTDNFDNSEEDRIAKGSGKRFDYLKADDFKKLAYSEVKKNGYMGGENNDSSANRTIASLFKEEDADDLIPATDKDIEEINTWVESKVDSPTNNEYMSNAIIAWKKEYLESRDLNLIASLISVYLRDKMYIKQRQENTTSEYVGNTGDKIIVDINTQRVLYTKSGSQYAYNAPDTYVYEIKDAKGNIYVWSTYLELEGVKQIIATVKDHKEYKGVKQTILTRGKIID